MLFFFLKVIISGLIVAVVSSIGRKQPLVGGIFAALPVVSLLSLCFLYYETGRNVEQVSKLSMAIGLMVVPTAIFLLLFSVLLKKQVYFSSALVISFLVLIVLDFMVLAGMKKLGI